MCPELGGVGVRFEILSVFAELPGVSRSYSELPGVTRSYAHPAGCWLLLVAAGCCWLLLALKTSDLLKTF